MRASGHSSLPGSLKNTGLQKALPYSRNGTSTEPRSDALADTSPQSLRPGQAQPPSPPTLRGPRYGRVVPAREAHRRGPPTSSLGCERERQTRCGNGFGGKTVWPPGPLPGDCARARSEAQARVTRVFFLHTQAQGTAAREGLREREDDCAQSFPTRVYTVVLVESPRQDVAAITPQSRARPGQSRAPLRTQRPRDPADPALVRGKSAVLGGRGAPSPRSSSRAPTTFSVGPRCFPGPPPATLPPSLPSPWHPWRPDQQLYFSL